MNPFQFSYWTLKLNVWTTSAGSFCSSVTTVFLSAADQQRRRGRRRREETRMQTTCRSPGPVWKALEADWLVCSTWLINQDLLGGDEDHLWLIIFSNGKKRKKSIRGNSQQNFSTKRICDSLFQFSRFWLHVWFSKENCS